MTHPADDEPNKCRNQDDDQNGNNHKQLGQIRVAAEGTYGKIHRAISKERVVGLAGIVEAGQQTSGGFWLQTEKLAVTIFRQNDLLAFAQ